MTEPQAHTLTAVISQEMPTVSAEIIKRNRTYTLILKHKPTKLALSIYSVHQWKEIRDVWEVLEEE
jgi:hypothetical protein